MDKILGLVKDYAPALVGVMTGGSSTVATAAIGAIAKQFGVADTVEAVTSALQTATPEQLAKLKDIDVEEIKLANEDRANARAMQVEAIKGNDPVSKHFVYYFAWFWSVTSVIYFFCVTFIALPEGGRDFANIILGFVS